MSVRGIINSADSVVSVVLEDVVILEGSVESDLVDERDWAIVLDVEGLVFRIWEWLVDAIGTDPLEEAWVLVHIQEGTVNYPFINPVVECDRHTDSSNELGGVFNVCEKKVV